MNKHTNIKLKNLNRVINYFIILTFVIAGLLILLSTQFFFSRPPSNEVVEKTEEELSDIDIKFKSEDIQELFDSEYSVSDINFPGYKTKNPFLNF